MIKFVQKLQILCNTQVSIFTIFIPLFFKLALLLHKFIIKFWNPIVSCAKSIACLSGIKLKNFVSFHQHFDGRSTNISCLDFSLKPAVFRCLTIAPPLIVVKSCSWAQTDQLVFQSALKKIFFGPGWRIFHE